MTYATKIFLHLLSTKRLGLGALIEDFMRDGVRYVGVVGPECAFVEDVVDWICLGPCHGTREPYDMVTAWHDDETLEEAIEFAEGLSGDYEGHALGDRVQVVTLG